MPCGRRKAESAEKPARSQKTAEMAFLARRGAGGGRAAAGPGAAPLRHGSGGVRWSWHDPARPLFWGLAASLAAFFMPLVSYIIAILSTAYGAVLGLVAAPPFSGYSRTPRGWHWTGSAGGIAARGIKKGPLIADRARVMLYLLFPKGYHFFDIVRGIIGNFYALDADGGRRQV